MKPYKELLATGALSAGFVMAAYSVFILGHDSVLTAALAALGATIGAIAGVAYGKKE